MSIRLVYAMSNKTDLMDSGFQENYVLVYVCRSGKKYPASTRTIIPRILYALSDTLIMDRVFDDSFSSLIDFIERWVALMKCEFQYAESSGASFESVPSITYGRTSRAPRSRCMVGGSYFNSMSLTSSSLDFVNMWISACEGYTTV